MTNFVKIFLKQQICLNLNNFSACTQIALGKPMVQQRGAVTKYM